MKTQILLMCLTLCVLGHTMHLHPKHKVDLEEYGNAKTIEKFTTDVDGIPVDVIRNIPPTRFVPINSAIFFTNFPPCDEGFVRDFLGVCREVWD